MDSGDTLTLGMGAYVAGTFVLHRVRLARLRRDGLELKVVSRLYPSLPDEAEPVRASLQRAAEARARHAEGEVESEALKALGHIGTLGGRGTAPWLAYLDAYTRLTYLVNPTNLEWVGLTSLLRLRRAVRRWGSHPLLYLVLAEAEVVLGQVNSAVDNVGRAAFYAGGDRFFLELVLDSSFIAFARPELLRTCREALATLPAGPPLEGDHR